MSNDYTVVGADSPLRQGDILEARHESEPWNKHLFVLTADCDLAHKKHHGRVTCVSILTVDDYLVRIHLNRMRERLLGRALADFDSLARRRTLKRITRGRARDWLSSEGPEEIVASLGAEGNDANTLRAIHNAVGQLSSERKTLREAGRALVDAQVALPGGPSRDRAERNVHDSIQNAFSNSPGDALFLSSIGPGLEGHFAYLRHIEQVDEADISLKQGSKRAKYQRIARLRDRYSHALVQRFALVFLNIGLPDEYEEMREVHAFLAMDAIK